MPRRTRIGFKSEEPAGGGTGVSLKPGSVDASQAFNRAKVGGMVTMKGSAPVPPGAKVTTPIDQASGDAGGLGNKWGGER